MPARRKSTALQSRWFPHASHGQRDPAEFNILGIDPSLSCTGLVLIRAGKILWRGTLSSKLTGIARLVDLECKLVAVLGELPARVHAAVIEGYAFGASNQREALAEWGGILRAMLYKRELPLLECAPTTLKKFVLPQEAKGGKELMLLASYKRWGVEFTTNDECDAHALAQLGYTRLQLEYGSAAAGTSQRSIEAAWKAAPAILGQIAPRTGSVLRTAESARPRRR